MFDLESPEAIENSPGEIAAVPRPAPFPRLHLVYEGTKWGWLKKESLRVRGWPGEEVSGTLGFQGVCFVFCLFCFDF